MTLRTCMVKPHGWVQVGAMLMVIIGIVPQLEALEHLGQPSLLKIIFLLIVCTSCVVDCLYGCSPMTRLSLPLFAPLK